MIIGGEHIFFPSHFFRKSKGFIDGLINNFKDDYNVNFTFGGYYSLLAIIDEIKPEFDHHSIVLLPCYLCPSILKPFKLKEIQYQFYKVDENLFVDIDHLMSLIDENVKAVFIIDYFGASQFERLKPVIEILILKKITIIQDVVQCLQIRKEQLFGDFIFNSFRKFFPFEGSILLSKVKMNIHFSGTVIKFLKYKRIGQLMRYFHIKFNMFSSRQFLSLFRKAESHYYISDILRLPKFNIRQLNKYDIQIIVDRQLYYFNQLYKEFQDKMPRLLCNDNFVPLGFVISIDARDAVRRNMFEQNIFPPVHWMLSDEIDIHVFYKSKELSNSILTIPLINLNDVKFKYLIKNLKKLISN